MFVLEVKPSLVWKRLGMPGPSDDTSLRADFERAYARACGVLDPKYNADRWRIKKAADGRLEIDAGILLISADLVKLAQGAHALVAMAATVGEDLDAAVADYNARGEVFAMTVVDAVGSVAAEELIGLVHRDAKEEGAREDEVVSRRISPGYGDFPLEVQPTLLQLSGGSALGIRLTENYMMVPRKSVTAVAAVKRL